MKVQASRRDLPRGKRTTCPSLVDVRGIPTIEPVPFQARPREFVEKSALTIRHGKEGTDVTSSYCFLSSNTSDVASRSGVCVRSAAGHHHLTTRTWMRVMRWCRKRVIALVACGLHTVPRTWRCGFA